MEINQEVASEMLTNADRVADSVRAADRIRRNIYLIQIIVVVLCVAPFDVFGAGIAALVCGLVLAVGVGLTVRELRRSQVTNREAMVSYTVVIASWSILWVVLMTVVGPWLSDRVAIGWTLTGLIGTIPYVAGIAWEQRR